MVNKKRKEEDPEDESELTPEPTPSPYDDLEIEDVEELKGDKIRRLKKKLKICEKQKQKNLDGWQRLQADFLNTKKRFEEEKGSLQMRSTVAHVEKLLPLCDSFDMAMKDTEAWKKADPKWRVGIEMIHTQLRTILADYGVERLDAIGIPFDPRLHEAVSSTESNKHEANTVVEVLQNGYKVGEHLVRPAKVIVSE